MEKSNPSLNYMPQLDALRAFAVILVLLEHWMPHSDILHFVNPGYIGVTFFFVLSGFLITRILIKNKIAIGAHPRGKRLAIKQFIIRRALRIFPVYYLSLIIFYIVNAGGLRDKAGWYFLYGANFLMFGNQHWDGIYTHLWTLAVEEQFYLFWPFIILFTPQKYLLKVIFLFIAIGPLFRFMMLFYSGTAIDQMVVILTPSCFDAFGLGALLAYSGCFAPQESLLQVKVKYAYSITAVIVLALALSFWPQHVGITFYGFLIAGGSYLLIQKASVGFRSGIVKSVLESKILLYLGKISYGLYLFHNFIPYFHSIMEREFTKYGIVLPIHSLAADMDLSSILLRNLIYFLILVIIASASWYGFEKPINSLKRHFENAS